MAADRPVAAAEGVTTNEAAAPSGTEPIRGVEVGRVPSQFVELKLTSNPVGVRVLSTPDHETLVR